MKILIWITCIYLALGVGMTALLSQTPYSDNAWWITTLLWPLFLYALVAG